MSTRADLVELVEKAQKTLAPIKVYSGESLNEDGQPVRFLVAAKSQLHARKLLERLKIKVSRYRFQTYWPESNDALERSVAREDGVWALTQAEPREFSKLTFSVGSS